MTGPSAEARCRWCGDAIVHDDVRCLREERDALEEHFREAVDALSQYLQSGGKYAHLMQPGQSITKVGPAQLVEHFERALDALGVELAKARRERDEHRLKRGENAAEVVHWMARAREQDQALIRAEADLAALRELRDRLDHEQRAHREQEEKIALDYHAHLEGLDVALAEARRERDEARGYESQKEAWDVRGFVDALKESGLDAITHEDGWALTTPAVLDGMKDKIAALEADLAAMLGALEQVVEQLELSANEESSPRAQEAWEVARMALSSDAGRAWLATAREVVEAMRPLASLYQKNMDNKLDNYPVFSTLGLDDEGMITVGDLRRARALLARPEVQRWSGDPGTSGEAHNSWQSDAQDGAK